MEGRGTAVLDVHGPADICMAKLADVSQYPKMIPSVHSVDIYNQVYHANVGFVISQNPF
jgi:membrane protein involved in colicin uptake